MYAYNNAVIRKQTHTLTQPYVSRHTHTHIRTHALAHTRTHFCTYNRIERTGSVLGRGEGGGSGYPVSYCIDTNRPLVVLLSSYCDRQWPSPAGRRLLYCLSCVCSLRVFHLTAVFSLLTVCCLSRLCTTMTWLTHIICVFLSPNPSFHHLTTSSSTSCGVSMRRLFYVSRT